MEKRKEHAFKKDVYLLGEDKEGVYYWLEAPSWECDWYWGFGYIETYTNNREPDKSKDINTHQHATNFYPEWIIEDGARLIETTFTEKEGWELADLFKQFYLLKEMAEFTKHGYSYISKTQVDHGDMSLLHKDINEVKIPKIMDRIIEILTPTT